MNPQMNIPDGYSVEPLPGVSSMPPPQQTAPQSNIPDGYTYEPLPGAPQQQQGQTTQASDPNEGNIHKVYRGLKSLMGSYVDFQGNVDKGALASGATTLAHIINMVGEHYGSDVTDIPQYIREHPGATMGDAWRAIKGIGPNGEKVDPYVPAELKGQRDSLRAAGDWLAKQGKVAPIDKPGGISQRVGYVGGDILQWLGMDGALALATKPAEAAALASEVPEMAGEIMSTAQKYKRAGMLGDLFTQYPTLGKAAAIGTRVMHLVGSPEALEDPIVQQAIVGGTQAGIQSEGDPREITKGALIAGGATAMMREASQMAGEFLKKIPAAEDAGAAAAEEIPKPQLADLPEKPVKPKVQPVQVGPGPDRPPILDPVEHPPAPEKPPPIPKPDPLEPTPVSEPPVEPEAPEPSPLPPEPEHPGIDIPDRAPVEQRVADMESQLARGVVSDSSTTAAQHLENLNDSINHEDFTKLKPAEQQQIQSQRRSLVQYITRGSPPPDSEEFINQAGDFQTAADMMRQPGTQARARWNDLSGGEYETLENQRAALEGKVDKASVAKRGDIERALDKLNRQPKFMGSASPERRALYRSMSQQADVVEGAGNVIDKSYAGADRTGEFDAGSFQTNWKNYVNKYGVEQVKSALGVERYNSMNDFVNQLAKEPALDAASKKATQALYDSAIKGWKGEVAKIQASDQAVIDAQTEKFNDATDKWNEEKAKADEFDKAAADQQTEEWKQARIKQKADYDAAKADYDAGVDARNLERRQFLAKRGREYQQQVAEYKQAKLDAKNQTAQQRQAIDDAHQQAMTDWKAETKRIKDLNLAETDNYKSLQQAKQKLESGQTSKVGAMLAKLPKGKLGVLLAMSAAAAPGELAWQAVQHLGTGKGLALAGAGVGGYLLKRLLINPTAARLALQILREGGSSAAIYGPAIGQILRNTTNESPSTMIDKNAPGLVEPGNLDLRNRPVVQNADGSHSTELSFSREENGKEVLVPSVVNGKFMTPDGKMPPLGHEVNGKYVPTPEEQAMQDRAWKHYEDTGEHLGKFSSPEAADAYAERLHNRGPQ